MVLVHGEIPDGSPVDCLDIALRTGHHRSLGTGISRSREIRTARMRPSSHRWYCLPWRL